MEINWPWKNFKNFSIISLSSKENLRIVEGESGNKRFKFLEKFI